MFALTVAIVFTLGLGALAYLALQARLEDAPVPLTEIAGARVEYLQDFDGELQLGDVATGAATRRFQPLADAATDPNARRLPGDRVNWLRLTLPNDDPEAKAVVLQFAGRDIEIAEIYMPVADSPATSVQLLARTGIRVPSANRSVRSHMPAVALTLPPRHTSVLYVRNPSEFAAPPAVVLWRSLDDFRRHEQRELLPLAFFAGLLTVLLLYHAFAAALLQERSLLLFCAYLAAVIAFALSGSNVASWLVDGPAGVARLATILGLVALAALARLHFSRALLDTRQLAPAWDSALGIAAWVLAATAVFALALLPAPELTPLATRVVPAAVLASVILLPVAAVSAGWRGSRAAPLAAIAFACLAVGMGWVVLREFNLVSPDRTGGAPLLIGSALECLLLAAALVARQRARQAATEERFASNARRLERETADAKGDLLGLAHQLAESKRDKDRLIAFVAQDVRAPLGSLLAMSRSLPPERAAEHLPIIRRRCSALIELLNNVIDWARLRTGQFPHDPAPVSLALVADTALRSVESSASDKGVRLEQRISSTLPVRADGAALACVLRTLVGNALKFTATGGAVVVEARTAADTVELRVQDTGVGMTPEQLARLQPAASPGEVTPTPGTAGETGAGLGLGVARELLERDGGSLRFESTLGRGTVAIVTLPAEAKPAPTATVSSAPMRKAAVAAR